MNKETFEIICRAFFPDCIIRRTHCLGDCYIKVYTRDNHYIANSWGSGTYFVAWENGEIFCSQDTWTPTQFAKKMKQVKQSYTEISNGV